MESKKSIIALLVFFLSACSNIEERPKYVIHPDTMTHILLDIHLAEAKVSQTKLPRDTALSYYRFLENEIYLEYHVDSSRFSKSMGYYTENIKELDKIYEVVLDSLNLLKIEEEALEN